MATNRDRIEQEAMALLQRGQPERALEGYLVLLRHDPRDLRVRKRVAELCLQVGRRGDAEKNFREVADALLAGGQQRAAWSVFKQLTELRPDDITLWEMLGDCAAAIGFGTEARDAWESGMKLVGAGQPDRQLAFARRIATQAPNDQALQIHVAELLERVGRKDQASEEWTRLALEARRRGRPDDQARFFDRAISLGDNSLSARVGAAEGLLAAGDPRKALGHLQSAYREAPRDTAVLSVLARTFQAIDQAAKARQVWIQAARLHEEEGRPLERADALRNALAAGPDDAALRAELGEADQDAGRLRLRLDLLAWVSPERDDQVKAFVRAQTQARYGFPERALATIEGLPAELKETTSLRVLWAETLAELGRAGEAAVLLHKVVAPDPEAHQQLLTRLEILEGRAAGLSPAALLGDLGDELIDDEPTPAGGAPYTPTPLPVSPTPAAGPSAAQAAAPLAAHPGSDAEADAAELEARGDVKGAIKAWRDVLRVDPANQHALLRIGELMSQPATAKGGSSDVNLGDLSGFLSGSDTFAEIDPNEPLPDEDWGEGQSELALAYAEVGLWEDAQALAADCADLCGQLVLARSTRELEGPAAAVVVLRDAVDSADSHDPYFDEASYFLAGLLIEDGRLTAAKRMLDTLQQRSPDFRPLVVRARLRGVDILIAR
jgi:tetratricopeptide (TPR) repeat protein